MPNPHNLPVVLDNQSPTYRTFMVHALDAGGVARPRRTHQRRQRRRGGLPQRDRGLRLLRPVCRPRPVRRGAAPHARPRLRRPAARDGPAPRRGEHPAGQPPLGRARALARLRPRGLLARLPAPARPRRAPRLARPRPLHDAVHRLARRALPSARPPAHRLRRQRSGPAAYGAYGGTSLASALAAELGMPLYSSSIVESPADALRAAPRLARGRRRRVPAHRARAADGTGPRGLRALRACRCSRAPPTCPGARSCATPSRSARPTPERCGRHTPSGGRRRGRRRCGVRVRSTPFGLAEWRAVPVRPLSAGPDAYTPSVGTPAEPSRSRRAHYRLRRPPPWQSRSV